MTSAPADPAFLAFLHFDQAMRTRTRDQVINWFWGQRRFVARPYLPFVLVGGLDWRAPKSTVLANSDRSLLLRPVRDKDAFPEHFSSSTSHGDALWVEIHAPASNTSAEEALPVLQAGVERAHILTDLLSVLYGMPLTWFPAIHLGNHPVPDGEHLSRDLRPVSRSSASMTSAVVTDEALHQAILPRYEALRDMANTPYRLVLLTAFSWHAQGNSLGSGLNRFLNYWSAVELVATYLYDSLPRQLSGRRTRKDRRDSALALLTQTHTPATCWATVDQLLELKRPTIRTKASVLGIFSHDAAALQKLLFDPSANGQASLYSIRNDIAHGNVGQHHREFIETVDDRLDEMRSLSRTLLLRFLFVADRVESLLARAKRP